jgi:hypothetical protein
MTDGLPHEPSRSAPEHVNVDVRRLRLDREVAEWVEVHKRDHEINGWGYEEAVQDLLTVAYHREIDRTATRADRTAWIDAYTAAMAALTPEQVRAEEAMTARWNLGAGMSEVEFGLKTAARLGLRVRWYVDGGEVPEPEKWPRPYLDEADN